MGAKDGGEQLGGVSDDVWVCLALQSIKRDGLDVIRALYFL